VIDHLVDGCNCRDIFYALVLVGALAALTWLFRFCGS